MIFSELSLSAIASHIDTDTATRLRAAIAKLHRHLRRTRSAADAGLTPTSISVLFTAARRGPIRLSELATAEAINPTMLSRVVGDLVGSGLLARTSDPGDRRAALVEVTADGDRLVDGMRHERTGALDRALATLSDGDRDCLRLALPALDRLAAALEGRRP
jgi:DNA-binding MarR family transcriptional regulator